jgi:hypothetical protein
MGRHGLPVGVATPRALSTSAALRVLRAAVSTNMARSTSARSAAATLVGCGLSGVAELADGARIEIMDDV